MTLVVDGETQVLLTEALTVRDLLAEAGVVLDEDDQVTPAEPTFLQDGGTVRVVRVEVRTEVEQRDVPFERQTVRDTSVPVGETRLLEPGVTGLEELVFRVTFEDGEEVDRQLVRRVVLQQPRAEVILVGARAELKPVPITGTVVYVGNGNAWTMQQTNLSSRRLTHGGDLDSWVFSLSPDGAHLLFTRVPTATGDGVPLNTLWMMETTPVDAEPVRLQVEGVLWAGWSPGCTGTSLGSRCRVAYSTGVPAEGNPGWKAQNDLWVARPRAEDGAMLGRRQVVEPVAGGAYGWWGTVYAWSPSGLSLAYARAEEVGVVRVHDGKQTVLSRFPPYRTYAPWAWTPTVNWSSEGQFVISTLHGPSPTGEPPEDSPVFDVWVLAANGQITAELASEAGMWAAPTYSPGGDTISFGAARSRYFSQTSGYDLYVMDRDGSNQKWLFPPQEELGLDYPEVAWGPDGDRLIAVYQGNLYLILVEEGEVFQLTDDGSGSMVRWRW